MDDEQWLALACAELAWDIAPTHARRGSFDGHGVRWFGDGRLNIAVTCLDRHALRNPHGIALIAVHDDLSETTWTWTQLQAEVDRAAGALHDLGIGPGDRVGLCLPTIPEAAVAMLACARLGAVHGLVFAGFGAEALAKRWNELGCRVAVICTGTRRGGREIALKATLDQAIDACPAITCVLVVHRGFGVTPGAACHPSRELDWQEALAKAHPRREPTMMAGDAPLYVLHTSGSTGAPKPLLHSAAGSLLHAITTLRTTLDWNASTRYACCADLGWITGHSYVLYGPLALGAPAILDEGTPLHPHPGRLWHLVERHRLTSLFTVPTALRLIAAAGDEHLSQFNISTLRYIACAGEICSAAIHAWVRDRVGSKHQHGALRLVNIYGQSEAAGHLLAALPTFPDVGVGVRPCLGIEVALHDDHGLAIHGAGEGRLVITKPWPGLALNLHPDGCYHTGDRVMRDVAGIYHLIGRDDDILSLAGHRLAPAEIEAAVRMLPQCVDVCAVGIPDALRGAAVAVFVAWAKPDMATHDIATQVRAIIRAQVGAFATPRWIVQVDTIPRTRSAKPLRRLLAASITGSDPGDLSTLEDLTLPARLRAAVQLMSDPTSADKRPDIS